MPRPIVRSFRSMARVSKFDLDTRIADALDAPALAHAFEGCDVVFHCVVGNRKTILRSIDATYAACRRVGVKRLVYLSSAVVHGHNPRQGTDESSPLNANLPFAYSVSKVLAERRLHWLMRDGAVECVILDRSIVYGPGSTHWTARLASNILAGSAYFVDGGWGVCNTVFHRHFGGSHDVMRDTPSRGRQHILRKGCCGTCHVATTLHRSRGSKSRSINHRISKRCRCHVNGLIRFRTSANCRLA